MAKQIIGSEEFERAFARSTDPHTSHEAADSMEVHLADMEKAVEAIIASCGKNGATWDEIAIRGNLPPASISPRFKPLRRKNRIRALLDIEGNVVKRPGKSGRGQIVWISTT